MRYTHIARWFRWVLVLAVAPVLASCAEVPKNVASSDLQGIRKSAVITNFSGEKGTVPNLTGFTMRSYGYRYGLLGALVISARDDALVKSNLKSKSEELSGALTLLDPKLVLDQTFARLFTPGFETVNPSDISAPGIREPMEKESPDRRKMNDYRGLREKLGADTVLQIDFVYGLSIQGTTQAGAIIVADIILVRIDDGIVLLDKRITSSGGLRYTIDQFMENNAILYKEALANASEDLVYHVGLELGVNLLSSGKFYWQREKSDP